MVNAESTPPNLGAELMEELLRGRAGAWGVGSPFGWRQQTFCGTAEGPLPSDEQHAIGGHGESGGGLDRCFVAHLGLTHAEERLFRRGS